MIKQEPTTQTLIRHATDCENILADSDQYRTSIIKEALENNDVYKAFLSNPANRAKLGANFPVSTLEENLTVYEDQFKKILTLRLDAPRYR